MKNLLFILAIGFQATLLNAQDMDQNPNFMQSQEKYMASSDQYTSLQGTTSQETYKAIDYVEEKRERQAIRRNNRAMRPQWRHERRLERIKNTRYISSDFGINFGYSYPYYGSYRRFFRPSCRF